MKVHLKALMATIGVFIGLVILFIGVVYIESFGLIIIFILLSIVLCVALYQLYLSFKDIFE